MRGAFLSVILLFVGSICFAQSEVHDHVGDHATDSVVVVVDTVRVKLDGQQIMSLSASKQMIEGRITPYNVDKRYLVEAIDRITGRISKLRVEYDGTFWGNVSLTSGPNYIDVILREKNKQAVIDVDSTYKVLFVRPNPLHTKQAMLWVDQFSTAKIITADSLAVEMVRKIKDAGFNSIALEAKGATGYASYRKNNLSRTPYLSATKNVLHSQLNDEQLIVQLDTLSGDTISVDHFDLFGAICGAADTIGLKVYAVFDFFTEGSFTTRDTVSLNAHIEWETSVLSPSGIVPLSQSARARDAYDKGNRFEYAFTNPADPEVQKHELQRVREVVENYPVDGVIIGRCRYAGLDSDFSEISQRRFNEFLESRGGSVDNFPQDILTFNNQGHLERGELFDQWIEFRALVIADFVQSVRMLVDNYNSQQREVELASYVGDWYDKYFGYGVNWASDKFRYHDRLSFDNPEIYTETYAKTSYLRSLNFLIVGVFNETLVRDVALAELLTNGDLPLVIALLMPEQKDAVTMLHAAEASTGGIMLIDMEGCGDTGSVSAIIEDVMPKPKKTTDKKKK